MKIRVGLVGASRELHHAALRSLITSQPDFELVFDLPTPAWLASVAGHERADVALVLTDAAPRLGAFDDVLRACPRLRVVALGRDERAEIFELRPTRRTAGDVSAELLLALLRRAEVSTGLALGDGDAL